MSAYQSSSHSSQRRARQQQNNSNLGKGARSQSADGAACQRSSPIFPQYVHACFLSRHAQSKSGHPQSRTSSFPGHWRILGFLLSNAPEYACHMLHRPPESTASSTCPNKPEVLSNHQLQHNRIKPSIDGHTSNLSSTTNCSETDSTRMFITGTTHMMP